MTLFTNPGPDLNMQYLNKPEELLAKQAVYVKHIKKMKVL